MISGTVHLVAAAEFLAAKVLKAWHIEGVTGSAHELETKARRQVVAQCLYGADINGMAVEMCKISLWLVSLDPKLPFSFVDDKVLHGNSLLGITDLRQLEAAHIDPSRVKTLKGGTRYSTGTLFGEGSEAQGLHVIDVQTVIQKAVRLRHGLANVVDENDPARSTKTKRRIWHEYQELVSQLSDLADGVIAAGLDEGGKPGKRLDERYENLRIAADRAFAPNGADDRSMLDSILDHGLTPTVATDYERWKPLHWALAVPDVIERGGFDAVIGNPPFLGGKKLTGAMGQNVRDWLVNQLAGGVAGHADLVAYFFLRVLDVLAGHGTVGLIATNSIAQGDSREVGLDQMVSNGFTITRAVQSRPWPAQTANLEYAAVWGTRGSVSNAVHRISDGVPVLRVTTLLEPGGRVDGLPVRLVANRGMGFIGCFTHGMGFVVEASKASEWITLDPKNQEVLFPFLNGEELNNRPDTSASRWVVDFNARNEQSATAYPLPYAQLVAHVKPERASKAKAVSEAPWWLFFRSRPQLRKAVAELPEVLAIARVSKTVMPMRVPTGQVFSDALVVFATNSYSEQAVLSSSLHQMWAIKYGSGMRNDPRYTPSDVFETFPRPASTERLTRVGKALDTERREIMLRREIGVTKLYNLANDPGTADSSDADVARLREIHVELDNAVMAAYGWDDVALDHGFHTYRQMERWTVSPEARVEILDLLLEENHCRAELQSTEVSMDDSEDSDDE